MAPAWTAGKTVRTPTIAAAVAAMPAPQTTLAALQGDSSPSEQSLENLISKLDELKDRE